MSTEILLPSMIITVCIQQFIKAHSKCPQKCCHQWSSLYVSNSSFRHTVNVHRNVVAIGDHVTVGIQQFIQAHSKCPQKCCHQWSSLYVSNSSFRHTVNVHRNVVAITDHHCMYPKVHSGTLWVSFEMLLPSEITSNYHVALSTNLWAQ